MYNKLAEDLEIQISTSTNLPCYWGDVDYQKLKSLVAQGVISELTRPYRSTYQFMWCGYLVFINHHELVVYMEKI